MKKSNLRATAAWQALALLGAGSVILTAAPAFAQTTEPGAQVDPNAVPTTTNEDTAADQTQTENPAPGQPVAGVQPDTESDDAIVVTGTILRATAKATPSPVQVLDMDESEKRGVNTVNDAIQSISANGAGALPNSFTANGAFAAGAAAASLRGLLTSNTLVLFDGLRAAYYPLADDGTRNFVDLNTIPDAIVDRVEVLKDGASSTYGADAIAGVINVITKRQINGLHLTAEGGVSKYGDAEERRLDLTYGFGDLAEQGFNVYASAGYSKVGGITQRDRPYPYNTANLCNDPEIGYNTGFFFGDCNPNINPSPAFFVRPSGPNNNIPTIGQDPDLVLDDEGNVISDGPLEAPISQFQLLNPAAGCAGAQPYTLTPDQQEAIPFYPETICADDWIQNYFDISAPIERFSGSVRGTVALSDSIEAYAMGNFIQTHTWYDSYLGQLRRSTPPLLAPVISTATIALPVYICPDGIDCVNDPQRILNPQNPFAAQGSQARIAGVFPGVNEGNDIRTRGLRGATGISGDISGWRFGLDATWMHVKTRIKQTGVAYVANLLKAINTGELNFVNPLDTPQSVLDEVFPENVGVNESKMLQFQGSVARDLFELPGGPLQVGLGASYRKESVNSPSANPERDADGNILPVEFESIPLVDPTQRWTDRINPFGVIGSRNVKSVYGEILAPVIEQVDLSLSGRYDDYSTGQSNFSPKAGIKVTPIRELALRGTWSKGFRIGSFAESFGLPTTGYVTGANTVPDSYAALFPDGTNNPYLAQYSLGLTQQGNPALKPEKSRNITLGFVAEPIRNVSFSVDYWNIKKDDVITGADFTPALEAYYAGQPIPDGFQVIPDVVNPSPIPGVIDRAAFVVYSYVNAATQNAKGIDFAASTKVGLGHGITWSSSLEASRLLRLATCFDSGCQEFAGTIGPYVITSAAGSPKWRGSWQNIIEYGRAYASLTGFLTSGYDLTAEDITGPDTKDDCANSLGVEFNNGEVQCRAKKTLYWNLAGGVDVTDDVSMYFNINNLLDKKPPLDTATYGGYLYNPAWSHPMMIGRFFRVGAKVKM